MIDGLTTQKLITTIPTSEIATHLEDDKGWATSGRA